MNDHERPWTCPCGHELAEDNERVCLVWDRHNNLHRVPRDRGACECHQTPLRELESWRWDKAKRR